ncbi:MAG: pre-peptidase C-terminal domain-containing protein [Arthrospira sp. SH-MAG29]|nr:PA14 domain-containing protein [Arthrospira sp. SH-MAG29]MBS0014899.1 pre-peptidase C-terminal domain-containing protein [Arthrospira sp. SH-MAG29]
MFSVDTDTTEITGLLGVNPKAIARSDGDILESFGANQLLIGGVADPVVLPTLVSVAGDNLVIPLDMSVDQGRTPAETDSHIAPSVDSLTGIALANSYEQLQQFANSPEFLSQMSIAFGDDFDVEAAQDLADSLTNGTFEMPPTTVVSAADINGSNGAFAAETNNIYLSSEFVAENADNPEAIVSVLLEEIGHYIDSQINISDTPGDEGAIFSGVVQGREFDAGELEALMAVDDTATVMINGEATLIEQSFWRSDFAGNTPARARQITVGSTSSTYRDWVGTADTNDYYRFTLPGTRDFNLTLNGLSADADVQLLDRNGTNVLERSTNSGTREDTINRRLAAGTYWVRVYPFSGANTNYNLTLRATTPPTAPTQPSIPSTNWKAEYFNNTNLTGSPVFVENLGSGSQNFSRNWGTGAPRNTPADNFSARISTQRYLAPGLYKIQAQADDGVRVRVNNQTVIDKWVDQPFVTNSGYFRSNGGNVPVTVEYYERSGAAAINFSITRATKFQDRVNESREWKATVHSWNGSQSSAPPTNFWLGDLNNANAIGVINLGSNTRTDGKKGINVDWGSGAPNGDGNRLPHDNFAMRAYTWADFDGTPHKFRVRGDDGFQLLAHNQATGQWYNITPANQWSQAYGTHSEITYTLPRGRYDMHFHHYEARGNAYLDLSWEKVNVVTPPPSSQYYPNLASFSDYKWDIQSGDDNQFRRDSPFGGGNQMWKTDSVVRQVYTDLSTAIFGYRVHMNTGYAYDQGYRNYYGKWHAGIDMGARANTPIKAVIGGTVNWVNHNFMGINGDDGNHWVYGHLGTKYVARGQRIQAGTTLARLDSANHLHLEVQHGHGYKNTQGAHSDQNYVRSVTMSPLQAYWQIRNR